MIFLPYPVKAVLLHRQMNERLAVFISLTKIIIIAMKKIFIALVLGALLMMPCALCAEEVEIQLTEVIGLNVLPGDSPLDNPEMEGTEPTRPTSFRATINGNSLTILKQEEAIPSAQAVVVNAATGGVVVNEQFTNSLSRPIANAGVYVLRIETAGGDLVGQFVVQ